MALIDDIKLASRISASNTSLDAEITRLIGWTQAELIRVGVPSEQATDTTKPLIAEAIISGVLSKMATDEKMREAAEKSFELQKDGLRKYTWPETEGE